MVLKKKNSLFFEEINNKDTFTQKFYPLFSTKSKVTHFVTNNYVEIKNREFFKPTIVSILYNPFYIIRKELYNAINNNKDYICGIYMDFGCGSKPYKKIFNVDKCFGIDIESSGHNNLIEDIDVYYNGKDIPFQDEYFDSIFTSEVFEHVFNIDEINRGLKINGNLMITVPFVWNEHEIPYDFARYTSYGIKYLLNKHGFEVVESSKTTTFIETIIQMWCTYLYEIMPKNKIFRVILTIILILPSNVLSIILSKVLPKNYTFYNNNVIVAKKTRNNKIGG